MKTSFYCLILFTCTVFFHQAYSIDLETDEGKIAFVEQFLDRIESEEEFSLEDDFRFFKSREIARYLLLHQLGYVNKAGTLIGEEPKASYSGRLLKLNRHLFSRKGYQKDCEAVVKRGVYNVILVYRKTGNGSVKVFFEEDCYKMFVFSLVIGDKDYGFIDLLESSINGKPMLYLLGFKYPGVNGQEKKQSPQLPEEMINKIR